MPFTNTSPNMLLPVPIVGVDPGPQYAIDIDSCLAIIDSHNHSIGSGVQITPAGLNISSDLTMMSNNLISVRSVRFAPQSSPINLATDIGVIYESGVDLYYNDGSGNQIRITQGGNVAGSSGTITGLPSGTASASYGAGVFTFQAATNTPANLDGGSIVLRNNVANSNGLTLSPPNSMPSNFTITLPSLPGLASFVLIDASGTMSTLSSAGGITGFNIANQTITGSNIANGTINDNQIGTNSLNAAVVLQNATITTTQIASSTIVGGNIASGTIAGSNIATQTITNTNIALGTIQPGNILTNIDFNGKFVGRGGRVLIASNSNPSTNGLNILRAGISGVGALFAGEGASSTHPSTGQYGVSFTVPFFDVPIITVQAVNGTATTIASISSISSSGVTVVLEDAGTPVDVAFFIIAIGQST